MIKIRSFHVPSLARGVQRQVLLPALLLASSSVLLLSGCSSGLNFANGSTAGASDEITASGKIHGGQAPVVGAVVSVYEIPTGGTGGTAAGYYNGGTNLTALASSSPSNSLGDWSVTFTCANTADDLLFVSVGGEGGVSSQNTTPNSALILTSVGSGTTGTNLGGKCSTYAANPTFIWINEVTTVATEYALAGFSSGYKQVGTSANNTVGLVNAFATVGNLVNLTNGTAYTSTPAYPSPTAYQNGTNPTNTTPDVLSSIVPSDLIYTLANAISTCVNATNGESDAACSGSTGLFSYTGGANSQTTGNGVNNSPNAATTQNTADAVLFIAHNPGLPSAGSSINNNANVQAIYAMGTFTGAPFGPGLAGPASVLTDFTMTVNFVSGGLGGTSSTNDAGALNMAIDIYGDIWTANKKTRSVSELNNLGAPLSPNSTTSAKGGFTSTKLVTEGRIDTDKNGNAWVAENSNCLVEFSPSGAFVNNFTLACPETGAAGVAVDKSNNVWVNGEGFIGAMNNAGTSTLFTPLVGGTIDTLTSFLGPDASGNTWFLDQGNYSGGYVTSAGSLSEPYASVFGGGPYNYATFALKSSTLELWVPQPSAETLQLVTATSPYSYGSGFIPNTGWGMAGIQSDGNSNVFFANGGNPDENVNPNITAYTGGSSEESPYLTAYTGGSALMSLASPEDIGIDQSGNLWVINTTNNNAANLTGPYAAYYVGTGANATNLTEFVGLAAPTQPVNALNAANNTYGVKP